MIKKLKPYGLHHALPIFAGAFFLAYNGYTEAGMAISYIGAGIYIGREEFHGEIRGLTLNPSTWTLDKIEWLDFLVPCAVAAFNIWIIGGM